VVQFLLQFGIVILPCHHGYPSLAPSLSLPLLPSYMPSLPAAIVVFSCYQGATKVC